MPHSSPNKLPASHKAPLRISAPLSTPSTRRSNVSRGGSVSRTNRRWKVTEPFEITQRDLDDVREFAEDENDLFLSDDVEGVSTKQKLSSWTISLLFHGVVVLILAFLFFPGIPEAPELEATFSTELGDQLDFFTDDEGNLNPNQNQEYKLVVPEEVKVDDLLVFEEKELPFEQNVNAPVFEQTRVEMSDMLAGRTDPGVKNDLLSKYGGSKLTEDSVEAGLQWLRRQQQKDGSWSLRGPYASGLASRIDNQPAATALALLAFQGAGNTRSSGDYSSVVRRGWLWLLRQQDQDGCFTPRERVHEALFYTHAICTLALCELITLEKKNNTELRKSAKKAIDYLLENQNVEMGGWRYDPQVGSDLSVTGWCLMALRTAEMAGFKIPKTHYERISAFLDSVSYDDGAGYVYQLDSHGKISDLDKRPSMTATGLLCREYLGWPQNEEALRRGAEQLAKKENLIRFPTTEKEAAKFSHNVYGWYSTSMALKGLGPYNKNWRAWNGALSRELPQRQEPKNSKEAGSWNPQYDEYSFGGGRLYVTCMSILCLEAYYRHMPIYQ
ncbi:MAG: terpene cyclase/mutase family protein [Thermoguttaceae bacterium]|nr:terpene cyclase/mutase family protein [Thermoguttaceae bacterium]